jgi:hypothetical protein
MRARSSGSLEPVNFVNKLLSVGVARFILNDNQGCFHHTVCPSIPSYSSCDPKNRLIKNTVQVLDQSNQPITIGLDGKNHTTDVEWTVLDKSGSQGASSFSHARRVSEL